MTSIIDPTVRMSEMAYGHLMPKHKFHAAVLQLYLAERQGMSTLYAQVGLLLTGAVALGAAIHVVADPQITRLSAERFDCGLMTSALVAATACLVAAVAHLYAAAMPRTAYPVVNVNKLTEILKEKCADGVDDTSHYDKAVKSLTDLLRSAANDYRTLNEKRKASVQKGTRWLVWAGALVGIAAFFSHLIAVLGAING